MNTRFFGLICYGLAFNQVSGSPVFILRPFPTNLAIYYPLQSIFGSAFKDFGDRVVANDVTELVDDMNPTLNLEKDVHHPMYGGSTPGGFTAVDEALNESDPQVAGPAHESLKNLRHETKSQGKETTT
ncbi:uncharacterized protein PGTG_12225 [Puccinia graminis f. sp. tritici CRL 75-36-700-3]|uniref:Uncharacterized protein n=1 Tax=Puccinia graminis f. sp. tritici (strain CRL 75-36-700-3 / race SCCL) TaxID=418459 RepID=E3KPN4_PUCGT|nr:uncharacterized protein PGTG_12225 [Puccinia graminis f. sp. tritici CRL 75-36-700-3]EFP86269.1 hypothetical protein PGTG_12225 [Puccinia graminis f. sp. tritici CRL 75-36-700-3]